MKILPNKIVLGDILYYVGNQYDYSKEVKKVVINKIELKDNKIIINDNYYLYKRDNYFIKENMYFSEKKANNVIDSWIKIRNKEKERYKKQDIKEEEYKQFIIDKKLEEKYINKAIMIYQESEWKKTTVVKIFANHRGIYLVPKKEGHICKLSREGKTWKWWSELEELETQKKLLEEKIRNLKKNK